MLKGKEFEHMHAWRMTMAAFIAVMILLAVLLGRAGDPARVAFPSCPTPSPSVDGGGNVTEACPWQLDVVTLGRGCPGAEVSSVYTGTKRS